MKECDMNNDDAFVRTVFTFFTILVIAIFVIVYIMVVINGINLAYNMGNAPWINLAYNMDNAPCSEIAVANKFINQSSDGFLGIKTRYFITDVTGNTYELLAAGNVTSTNEWNSVDLSNKISVKINGSLYQTCDYPEHIPRWLS